MSRSITSALDCLSLAYLIAPTDPDKYTLTFHHIVSCYQKCSMSIWFYCFSWVEKISRVISHWAHTVTLTLYCFLAFLLFVNQINNFYIFLITMHCSN